MDDIIKVYNTLLKLPEKISWVAYSLDVDNNTAVFSYLSIVEHTIETFTSIFVFRLLMNDNRIQIIPRHEIISIPMKNIESKYRSIFVVFAREMHLEELQLPGVPLGKPFGF